LLRFTINHYTKKAEKAVADAAQAELDRLDGRSKLEADLVEAIKKHSTFFLCIQTQSESSWGLMHKILSRMQDLGLEIIDHRSWHPRGINTTVVNEIYCKGNIDPDSLANDDETDILKAKMEEVKAGLLEAINQPVGIYCCPFYPSALCRISFCCCLFFLRMSQEFVSSAGILVSWRNLWKRWR
jgi:hypothetical protein